MLNWNLNVLAAFLVKPEFVLRSNPAMGKGNEGNEVIYGSLKSIVAERQHVGYVKTCNASHSST